MITSFFLTVNYLWCIMATKLEQLTKKKKQIEAKITNLKARNSAEERKKDARKKILLGAFLLNSIENNPEAKVKLEKSLPDFLLNAKVNDRTKKGNIDLFLDVFGKDWVNKTISRI